MSARRAIGPALALALASAPATALERPTLPDCHWDAQAGRFASDGRTAPVSPTGRAVAETPFVTEGYSPRSGLLNHCPGGTHLLYTVKPDGAPDAAWLRWQALTDSTIALTLAQIGRDMTTVGRDVQQGHGGIAECACAALRAAGELK